MQAEMTFSYPVHPGWKEGTTDKEAAQKASGFAQCNREKVMAALVNPKTAEELSALTGLDVYECRRRCSDLRALGKIRPDGKRKNQSGNNEIIWAKL